MTTTKESVPLHIPKDIWQPLVEIRAQLTIVAWSPLIQEALREIINHYRHCSISQEEIDAFCEKAQAWKGKDIH